RVKNPGPLLLVEKRAAPVHQQEPRHRHRPELLQYRDVIIDGASPLLLVALHCEGRKQLRQALLQPGGIFMVEGALVPVHALVKDRDAHLIAEMTSSGQTEDRPPAPARKEARDLVRPVEATRPKILEVPLAATNHDRQ